jgi:glutaconate CoA-transferase subunit A
MADKRMTEEQVVAELRSGMTIGIGGWGSRRKPMSLVRAILRSDLKDLSIVSYGGPDVGLLCAAGKVKKLTYGFVSLDSIPLEPHFQNARKAGAVEVREWDEGMVQWGLYAASLRLPFLPTKAGLGSDVITYDPTLKTVADPYGGEDLLAVPALHLDAALVHLNVADVRGNASFGGPDLYFDDLFCQAAEKAYLSCERIVTELGELTRRRIARWMVAGVVEAPGGAHFTSCVPDYERDEPFQKEYAAAAKDPELWAAFEERFLKGSEASYQQAVKDFHSERKAATA